MHACWLVLHWNRLYESQEEREMGPHITSIQILAHADDIGIMVRSPKMVKEVFANFERTAQEMWS